MNKHIMHFEHLYNFDLRGDFKTSVFKELPEKHLCRLQSENTPAFKLLEKCFLCYA